MEAKKMLTKSDLLTGLLDHRDIPPQAMTYSPAQKFLCRRTKSNLPIAESSLSQSVPPVTVVHDEHLCRWAKAKAHYEKTASRDLSPLALGAIGVHQAKWPSLWWTVGSQRSLGRGNTTFVRGKNTRRVSYTEQDEPQVPCDPPPLPEQPVIENGADVGNSAETIVPNSNSESPRLDPWNWRLECSVVLDVDYYDIACSHLLVLMTSFFYEHINMLIVFFDREDDDRILLSYHRGQRCSPWAILCVRNEHGCLSAKNKVLCSRKLFFLRWNLSQPVNKILNNNNSSCWRLVSCSLHMFKLNFLSLMYNI